MMHKEKKYYCGHCIHFHSCKRIDHKNVKFAIPWFACYDEHQFSGIICAEFRPKEEKDFNFDDYWKDYVENWLPYSNTNKLIYFTLHNDTKIRYGVRLMDFVNGTMIENNILKAVEREYYKRTKSGFGYKLVREPVEGGVLINEL